MVVLQILTIMLSVSAEETLLIAATILQNGETTIENITVPADGEYEISVSYKAVEESTQIIEYAVKIDGDYPFSGAELLEAPVIYEDDGEIRTLSNGDQTAPAQKVKDGYFTSKAYDKTGVNIMPYSVSLTAGEHSIEVVNLGDAFEFSKVVLSTPEKIKTYSEVSAEYSSYKKYDGKQIVIEAEKPLYLCH